jgi:hypothetical protein
MFKTTTIGLSIAPPATSHFEVGLGFQPLGPSDVALPLTTTQEKSSHVQSKAEKATRFIEKIQHICQ